jgi:hypothetical protein
MGDPAGEFVGFNRDDVRYKFGRVFQPDAHSQAGAWAVS